MISVVLTGDLEYAAGMSGPTMIEKYRVESARMIYLIVQKYHKEQANR